MKVIVNQPKQENKKINWDKPQLVTNKYSSIVILTSGMHDVDTFEGTVIKHFDPYYATGYYVNSWSKQAFKLFEGEIVITQ